MKQGGPTKADLLIVDLGDGEIVVKDFAAKRWWVRLIGRIQIGREAGAYGWLGAFDGVPGFLGRVDAHALALERVDGEQLAFAPDRHTRADDYVALLRELLDRLHARGLVHHDLRGRENLLVRPDGSLVIVDLAGAVWFRPGSLGHRLLFPRLKLTDEAAFLKWKSLLTHGRLTPEDEAFLARFRRFRALWPFNRKRKDGKERT